MKFLEKFDTWSQPSKCGSVKVLRNRITPARVAWGTNKTTTGKQQTNKNIQNSMPPTTQVSSCQTYKIWHDYTGDEGSRKLQKIENKYYVIKRDIKITFNTNTNGESRTCAAWDLDVDNITQQQLLKWHRDLNKPHMNLNWSQQEQS
jgi:hypothetical protein